MSEIVGRIGQPYRDRGSNAWPIEPGVRMALLVAGHGHVALRARFRKVKFRKHRKRRF